MLALVKGWGRECSVDVGVVGKDGHGVEETDWPSHFLGENGMGG